MSKIDTIYHYCSVDTFFAIIQNSTLRLSDLNKTNDSMEKRWIIQFIDCVLQEELSKFNIKIDLEEDYWYEEGINNHLQYYNEEMKRVLYNDKPMLITCFSEENDRLSQWRAYGQDGMGVAIGFNYKKIKQLKNKENNISVDKVIYHEQKQRLAGLIQSVIIYIKDMFENDPVRISDDFNEYFKEEFDAFCEVLSDYIEKISCIIKNPAFSEEKEVRIVYDPELINPEVEVRYLEEAERYFKHIKEIKQYKINPLKFNVRNNQLVAFCDINFKDMIKEEIIKEIVIGPKSKLSQNDIYYFMLSNGYDVDEIKISNSQATYR